MPLSSLDIDLYESEDPIWNPAMMAIPVPGIRKMVNMAASMEDVIHLSIGQPDLPAPENVVNATIEALLETHGTVQADTLGVVADNETTLLSIAAGVSASI